MTFNLETEFDECVDYVMKITDLNKKESIDAINAYVKCQKSQNLQFKKITFINY